jgi:hypothetical protein
MTTKELKCADKIGDELKSREADIKALFDADNYEEIGELALSDETIKLTKVCLSWGGPADYLEIEWYGYAPEAWEIVKVTYRYSDWYDTATLTVEEDSPLYEYARFYIEHVAS